MDVPKRSQGKRRKKNETEKDILLFLCWQKDGADVYDIKDYLKKEFGITQIRGIKERLKIMKANKLVKAKTKGNKTVYKITNHLLFVQKYPEMFSDLGLSKLKGKTVKKIALWLNKNHPGCLKENKQIGYIKFDYYHLKNNCPKSILKVLGFGDFIPIGSESSKIFFRKKEFL